MSRAGTSWPRWYRRCVGCHLKTCGPTISSSSLSRSPVPGRLRPSVKSWIGPRSLGKPSSGRWPRFGNCLGMELQRSRRFARVQVVRVRRQSALSSWKGASSAKPARSRGPNNYFATATVLIDDIEDVRGDYRAFLKGTALVEQANVLRHLGDYAEALPVLDRADGLLEGIPSCTHELGRAWFTRGTLLFKMDRLDEATHWLRRAVSIFAAVTDARRVARVRLVEANVLYEQHRVEEACALWRTTLPVFAAGRDRRTEAMVWLNLGWCGLDQNRGDEAKRWLEKALARFENAKDGGEHARARWGLAVYEARYGDRQTGLARLTEQRDAFTRADLKMDAAMAGLDIAETLLLPPAYVREARAVLRQLVPTFRAAGANREMLRALAYLADAARQERATPSLIRLVRADVRRASHDATFRFVAPETVEAGLSPASGRPT